MAMFKGFKPQAMNKIAGAMGYQGDMNQFQQYVDQDPARQQQMNMYTNAARMMAAGGYVPRFNTGGVANNIGSSPGNLGGITKVPEVRVPETNPPVGPPLDDGPPMLTTMAAGEEEGGLPPQPDPQPPVQPQPPSNRGVVTNPAGTQAGTPTFTGASPTQYNITPATYYQEGDELPEGVNVGDEKTAEIKNQVPGIGQFTTEQMYQPGLPIGGTTIAAGIQQDPRQMVAPGTGTLTGPYLESDPTPGVPRAAVMPQEGNKFAFMPDGTRFEVPISYDFSAGAVQVPTATANTYQAEKITPSQANTMDNVAMSETAVTTAMDAVSAAQTNEDDPRAKVTAAQQTASSVGDLTAAQGNAHLIDNKVVREIQEGEIIDGVANAEKAAKFTEQIEAATAKPSEKATVAGQLDGLMQQFDGGATPAWAAGAMRKATATMAARGLGASSLAGQAIIQAAMESALPIAQADAAIVASFEEQNLSNRQQRAILAAQQRATFMGQEFDQAFEARVKNSARIGDIANSNFTNEQSIQLENSRAVNTMELNNVSNKQALVIAEASALAGLDLSNLNNRQQESVKNAQNFLQMDMANLSNEQQTELFKAQQRVQSMFTDQAATNAAEQFNASSENQTDQFFQNLGAQVSQFNATQANAQSQYNAGQANTVNRFNAELNNQRDQFNAQNQLVIAQSNAQWRRQIATADTAAVNRANELNANAILDISKTAYDNLWNYYNDTMEWAWTSSENDSDRLVQMALGELSAKTTTDMQNLRLNAEESGAIGGFFGDLFTSNITGSIAGKLFGF